MNSNNNLVYVIIALIVGALFYFLFSDAGKKTDDLEDDVIDTKKSQKPYDEDEDEEEYDEFDDDEEYDEDDEEDEYEENTQFADAN